MPKVLPLPMMFVQRPVRLASCWSLVYDRKKGTSLAAKLLATGVFSNLVPQARRPESPAGTLLFLKIGKFAVPASAALFVQFVPLPVGPASVGIRVTVSELGRIPVSVLLIKSPSIERLASPFGVIIQEQQETSCSSGENV